VALEEFTGNILYFSFNNEATNKCKKDFINKFPSLDYERISFSSYSKEISIRPYQEYSCVICDLPFLMDKRKKEIVENFCLESLKRNIGLILIEVG
jgi:hypothetical protein